MERHRHWPASTGGRGDRVRRFDPRTRSRMFRRGLCWSHFAGVLDRGAAAISAVSKACAVGWPNVARLRPAEPCLWRESGRVRRRCSRPAWDTTPNSAVRRHLALPSVPCPGAVAQLRVIDRVRLLQIRNTPTSLASRPSGKHLRPTDAPIALQGGGRFRLREDRLIPRQTSLKQFDPIPQRKCTPCHQCISGGICHTNCCRSVPSAAEIPRWTAHEVLREHDPAFQLGRSRVAA
jgi:hypothetical protein